MTTEADILLSTKCRRCNKEFRYGEYKEFGICGDCVYTVANAYPADGDTCQICEGPIMYTYTVDWESNYICKRCGWTWAYD